MRTVSFINIVFIKKVTVIEYSEVSTVSLPWWSLHNLVISPLYLQLVEMQKKILGLDSVLNSTDLIVFRRS